MQPIVECVPNFSEGRRAEVVEEIAAAFRNKPGLILLDVQTDPDHNRMVLSAAGTPAALKPAVLEAAEQAIALIDLRRHRGQHPRMGAVDVVPFVPIRGISMEQTVALSKEVAAALAAQLQLPVFLYENSATAPQRANLAAIRKGEFEGLSAKLADPQWQPDFGPSAPHPTAGACAVGARPPLVAFNVNLATDRLEIAEAIACRVRHIGGGLHFCKAMAVALHGRGRVQVSMNMTDFAKTALYQALELIRVEARRYGVAVAGSEIVGLVPMQALVDCAAFYLGLEGFSPQQVLETRLMESCT
jgi:glutamate formiminotransferase